MQQLFPSFSYPCRYTQQRLPNGWPHRPLLDVQDGSSLAALLADGPSAGERRSCMDKLYGTPSLCSSWQKKLKKIQNELPKLEALSESDSLSDLYDSFKACLLQQTNYLLSHFTILMDSNCSIKLPLVDIIWKIAYRNQVNKIVFVFFWGGVN